MVGTLKVYANQIKFINFPLIFSLYKQMQRLESGDTVHFNKFWVFLSSGEN